MDGIHDLGGREGFGPLPLEDDEPVFHHDWEARVMAMRLLMGAWRKWNIDAGRHSVETLPPGDYLTMSYYEKWLASLVNLSVRAGLISPAEITGAGPDAARTATPPIDTAGFLALIPAGRPSQRDIEAAPAFAIGDMVRTARHGHSGHTRLPGYLRGCGGEVILAHGAHVLPDAAATLTGEAPEPLYTVRFRAQEIWGPDADPSHCVTADLWESYLVAQPPT